MIDRVLLLRLLNENYSPVIRLNSNDCALSLEHCLAETGQADHEEQSHICCEQKI